MMAFILQLAYSEPAVRLAFWLAAGTLFYVYAGYPLLLAAITLFIHRQPPEPGYCPRMSILIAAHNEEAVIETKIRLTLDLEYPSDKLELLVLSDCSTDRTDEIVSAFEDPRVRLVRIPECRGKTHAQNCGARQATGTILVFSEAAAVYHSQALLYLACNYQDPNVGAVSGCYQSFDSTDGSPAPPRTSAIWSYENLIRTMQSRIHTITGTSKSIYSVRAAAYTHLPDDIVNDQVQPLHVIQDGYRVVFEDRAVAYDPTAMSSGNEFALRVRKLMRGMRGLSTVSALLKPWRFCWPAFQLWSHELLRWLVPLFLLLLFSANLLLLDSDFYRLVLAVQLFFYAAAIVNILLPVHRLWKPLGLPLQFCTLNMATLAALFALSRDWKSVTWQTARTRR
jgi:glycosyltransferase involved in cell wall biosynthesis